MPATITYLGKFAFYHCTGLTSVVIPSSLTYINEGVFNNCTGLRSVTIPNSITSIYWAVFSGCRSLTSVTIPAAVNFIDEAAFMDCTGLTVVNCLAAAPPMMTGDFSFYPEYQQAVLYVPQGSVDAYCAHEYWSLFQDILGISANGDLNGDGLLDVSDVVMLIKVVLDSTNLPDGDLNGDGIVDVSDVVALISKVLNGN